MINQETSDSEQQEITDAKRLKRFKILTPVKGVLEGSSTTFDGSYLNFFLTDVYKLPIVFTGILSAVTLALTWIFTPTFAAFSDKFKFKKSKFWPWPIIGGTVTHLGYIAVMVLPAVFGENVSSLGPLAFALILLIRMSAQISGVPVSGMAPLIAKTPADRQFLAQGTKIGHEAGKAIWGYLIPPVLLATTNFFGGDQNKGYVLSAAILHSIGWTGLATYALFAIKGSYVEREAMKQTEQLQRKRIPMSQTLKVLFTNRPVLGIFLFFALHKAYFFIYVVYGVHVYKYIFNRPEAVGVFMAIISIAAMAGVFCGRLWTKIFKESKRSCAMAMSVHIVATLVIALTFNRVSIPMFLVFFAISSFFMGMLETWVTPLYTACAEYGSWKTGVTMNALIMSTNGLTISSGSALPPVIASIVIGSAALGSADYIQGLTTLFAWVPLFLSIASLLCFVFIYNLNDTKIRLIQEDLNVGKTQATSDLKI
jgi:Na+/melibiose symporter-like transporter